MASSLWSPPRQRVSSAQTSLCQVPALLKQAPLARGVNLDIGGGHCDRGTAYLKTRKVTSYVFDPFNRPAQENLRAAKAACCGQAATVTLANVLNVIPEAAGRRRVLQQAADAVGAKGTVYVDVYEGDRQGNGKRTSRGWQANRALASYQRELSRIFKRVQVVAGRIEASQPRRATCACPR